ncbi:hypothetical protein GP486_007988 [Trichoglossum hirsutum]|uniref:CMP/dCMP-type deaminase domain-containing protein n=1 Tax=Trichoglossum hirsutum TaxID=265104 RepID=A0A9P8L6I6_9PEZI|nr:hypothetical protein GP486_007988 [Trichoglossum hirsutum]
MTEPIAPGDHTAYMRLALSLSRLSPAQPSNYRVGAVLVSATSNTILSSGYTQELAGNTHAEQNCLAKLGGGGEVPAEEAVLYTTMEPCVRRLSGNASCVERILRAGIRRVFVGVLEPDVFVACNDGRAVLERGGVEVVRVPGLEDEILEVAMAGHEGRRRGHGVSDADADAAAAAAAASAGA